MADKTVPNYDYSFLKKLGESFYSDFGELLEAYFNGVRKTIFVLSGPLFERGFKFFLEQEGKLDLFFDGDPSLFDMVFSPEHSDSRDYIKSKINIDYGIVDSVRDSANTIKHKLYKKNTVLHKALVLTEVLSLFVQVHNYYYTPVVEMPSKEYIEYVCSFNEYKEHKLEDIDKEIRQRLEKAELEIKSKLNSAEERLVEKQSQILVADSKLNEVQSEIERSGLLLDEANAKISATEDLLKEKAQEIKELDDYLTKRKAEIVLTESSQADNDLYELANNFLSSGDFDSALRVFKNIQNSNIRDLRAFLGIILCQYRARTVDELLSSAVSCKRSLKNELIFGDIKFLKEADKQFIIDIATKIDTDILYKQVHSLITAEQFEEALKVVHNSNASEYDRSVLTIDIQEAQYLKATELLMQKKFDEAINLFTILNGYKDSKELLNFAKDEREKARQFEAENDPTIDNYNKRDFEIEGTVLKKFINKSGKTEVKIPRGIITLYIRSFSSCKELKSVVIPNGVTHISIDTFRNCSSLTHVEIPESVTRIEDGAFYGCSSLKSIEIPNSVTSIDKNAFRGCGSLTSIKIPDSVTFIGREAFAGCSKLKNIIISNSVTSINYWTFVSCNELESVIIPSSVTSIGTAFVACERLTNIIIPNSVTSIAGAFSYCNSLTHIEIPSSVATIGDSTFEECRNLANVVIERGVKNIGSRVFRNCISLTHIEIPDSVITIGSHAFEGCTELMSMTIPNSVTSIGNGAFSDCCNLTSISIPDSVTNIGMSAFSNCDKLTSVIIGNGVKALNSSTFQDCSSLKSIILPSNINYIWGYTFFNCINLTHVEIYGSPYIDSLCVFEGCKNLKMIIYHGTKAQWEEKLKRNYNPPLKGISIKCNDGIIDGNN